MAADLTSKAKYADTVSPEGRAAFQDFMKGAQGRRAGDVKALHVFRREDGIFYNLDFGIAATDLEHLLANCSTFLLLQDPDYEIPLQPEVEWWNFWTAPILKTFMRYHCPTHKHSSVFLTVRGGEWPKT